MKKFKEYTSLKDGIDIKKASMNDVIKDFKSSDAPQFKGKSEKKKKEMAIAAKLSKEEVEIDEGSDDNLVELIRDITSKMIGAIKKNDQRKLLGLYKNLGKVIK